MSEQNYKVLVNLSTLMTGGVLQAAAALIVHAIRDPVARDWHYAISSGVADEIRHFGIEPDGPQFHVFEKSPARDAGERERLLALEAELKPDLVFTLFGPAYVRFISRHLCGVADPWVTHSNWVAFQKLPVSQWPQKIGLMAWKAYWWLSPDFWWTEAEVAKDGLVSRLRCSPEDIFVVPNTTGPQFNDREFQPAFPAGDRLEILCLSAYYEHKNLELIPDVALEMSRQRPELDFRFTLTLPEDWPQVQGILARARELGVEGYLNNLGKVAVTDTPDLYARSHLCFLPSLLEVFSAVYPECLCTGVPLVTTDMRFSRDICQDAAAYYRPGDARSAAGQIIELAENEQAWRRISERGREVYAALPDAAGKWELQKAMVQEAAGRS